MAVFPGVVEWSQYNKPNPLLALMAPYLQADPGYSPGSFRTALQSYLELVRESPLVDGEDITFDEELLEELRALGYLDP